MENVIVTGGLGFIGTHLVEKLLTLDYRVIVIDKLTYAHNANKLNEWGKNKNIVLVKEDICNVEIKDCIFETKPSAVFHLAAETHVDNSIENSNPFIDTNIYGTYNLLKIILDYWIKCPKKIKENFKFINISTDEVFGVCKVSSPFNENSRISPNSPYSASKASADHLVNAWNKTFKLPCITTNCGNNYGPNQNLEKLIPKTINSIINKKKIPVYGNGKNIRDWIYVTDHIEALILIMESKFTFDRYLIGSRNTLTNLKLVEKICKMYDHLVDSQFDSFSLVEFVEDRKGHDFCYALNPNRIEDVLGWKPKISLEDGLNETIKSYL